MQSNSKIDKLSGNSYHSGKPDGEEESAKVDRLLTLQEVCELLQVKKNYVYSLTHKRKIPHIKIQRHLRFRRSAIEDWLSMQEIACDASKEEAI